MTLRGATLLAAGLGGVFFFGATTTAFFLIPIYPLPLLIGALSSSSD